ncbi:leader peptide processing enzyme [Treponema sp. R80B11-R83G3]
MNKKVNTILFILGATLFNTIVAVVSFIILFLLYAKFLIPVIPQSGYSWAFTLIFIAAIAISILVYRVVLKHFINKINVEQYFDPLFVKRNLKKQ